MFMVLRNKKKESDSAGKSGLARLNLACLGLLLLFGLVACSSAGNSVSPASPASASPSAPTTGSLPDMPDDVPIYPEANHTTGTRVGTQTVGSWKTTATTSKVIEFYTKSLPESGWTLDKNDSAALGATLSASKQNRKLTVAITQALPEGAVFNISHKP